MRERERKSDRIIGKEREREREREREKEREREREREGVKGRDNERRGAYCIAAARRAYRCPTTNNAGVFTREKERER